MSNHTPGPWEAATDPLHFHSLSTVYGGDECNNSKFRPQLFVQVGGLAPLEEQEANTRLIAAAPDLLAALESMVLYYGCGPAEDDASEKLYRLVGKALDKAKGQSEKTDKT